MSEITEVIPGLGSPPLTTDPATFDSRADTLYGTTLPAAIASMNTAFGQVNTVSGEVNTNATNAEAAAVAAAASEAAAAASSSATKWVTGGPFVEGDVRWSPIDFKSYRCKVDNTGTTDPSADSTNWESLGAVPAIAQIVSSQTSAVATGTTIMPVDDTIPQNTEGDQYLTVNITPTSATSILYFDINVMAGHSAQAFMTVALFQDSTADALAATGHVLYSTAVYTPMTLMHSMVAGSTGTLTFKVRVGGQVAGTTTINGRSGARYFGGIAASSIKITEVLA